MDYERRLSSLTRATEDATEGRQAFREKCAPRFTGRTPDLLFGQAQHHVELG